MTVDDATDLAQLSITAHYNVDVDVTDNTTLLL